MFKRENLRYIKKFFALTGSITGIYLVLTAAVTVTLIAKDSRFFNDSMPTPPPPIDSGSVIDVPPDTQPNPNAPPPDDGSTAVRPPARTNFLLIGLDQSQALTDSLIAMCFYRDTCDIKIMSIPRDWYTKIPEERLKRMREDNLRPPDDGVMKINAVRSYGGGRTFGNQYLIEQLNDMLGITFNYYVEVDIPAFKKIVDILGEVEMDIPPGGMYYDDPEQNLHIAIPGGRQRLNGDMAEHVVRFRQYPSGDLGRNAMQMEFLKQLFVQVLRREVIMSDPIGIANIIINDVRTNIGVDSIKYLPYLTKFSADNLTTYTVPGWGEYVDGVSWFFPDRTLLAETINEVFYAPINPSAAQPDGQAQGEPAEPDE